MSDWQLRPWILGSEQLFQWNGVHGARLALPPALICVTLPYCEPEGRIQGSIQAIR